MKTDEVCEHLSDCNFFITEMKIESIANRFKQRYCNSCKHACAIYMIYKAKGQNHVPPDLFPNEYDKALEIMSGD